MTTDLVQRLDMNALISKALVDGVAVETLERLFALAKDVRAENAKAAWHQAMAQFQASVPEIVKSKVASVTTRTGGSYKYAYAPLDEIISTVRPVLASHGLSVTFEITIGGGSVTARCIVAHEEGHSQYTDFTIPIDLESRMNPAQQVASASTYARRYAYLAALGLAPEDDDDGGLSGAVVEEPRQRTAQEMGASRPGATPDTVVVPTQEFTNDAGQPIWRGVIMSHLDNSGVNKKTGKPYTLHFFKGQGGKEFKTFDAKFAAELIAGLRTQIVEICWEPGMPPYEKDRNIVSWKVV